MSPFQPGDLIGGRYRLMRIIGAGAMGTVWAARNESTDRDFALKLMLPDAAKNQMALQRFFQEAKASGRLRHRSIHQTAAPRTPRPRKATGPAARFAKPVLGHLLPAQSIRPFGPAAKHWLVDAIVRSAF